MPIYEYKCPSCGHQFEELVRLNSAAPLCPRCDASDSEKLISSCSFELRGSGWYKDGYGLKKP